MPRKKGRKEELESILDMVYKTTIRYMCPKRGWVEQEVEVKRYRSIAPPEGAVRDDEIPEVPLEIVEDESVS